MLFDTNKWLTSWVSLFACQLVYLTDLSHCGFSLTYYVRTPHNHVTGIDCTQCVPASEDMLHLAITVLLSIFVREGALQFQEVRPDFCPSSELRGVTCDATMGVEAPSANTLIQYTVYHLRCQSGCLMDVSRHRLTHSFLTIPRHYPNLYIVSLVNIDPIHWYIYVYTVVCCT